VFLTLDVKIMAKWGEVPVCADVAPASACATGIRFDLDHAVRLEQLPAQHETLSGLKA
jgi:hypothetical protein